MYQYLLYNTDMNKQKASRIRKEISVLRGERKRFEDSAFKHRRMIDACLIERYLGTKKKKRTTPAFYLSQKIEGKTKLEYVKNTEVAKVKRKTEAWKEYSLLMQRIVSLNRRIERLLRKLGKTQVEGRG
jgi:hypothetical protein